MPDVNWSAPSSFSSLMCDFLFDYNLSQYISESTHHQGNILDLVLSNSIDRLSNVLVHPTLCSHMSDHHLITFNFLSMHSTGYRSHPEFIFNYLKADFSSFNTHLSYVDFSSSLLLSDVKQS